ncbi:major royal jelly protein 2 [Cylas formicarius]|uniref:major royal jelly protein 2 n=1 Tax=Cylas formicarius TaxID=197179 RepID=UPI002958BB35|nr:major royal jelly protein 2 [Cylas formicarius]
MILKSLVFATAAVAYVVASSCDTIEWTGGPIEFPSPEIKSMYKSSGKYDPRHLIATRGQIFQNDLYVALPRYKPGVAVTLAKVCLKTTACEAVLTPFPCLSSQEIGNCEALQNVVDLFVDPYGILWALDIGVVNTLEHPVRKAPPKVVAYNLNTGKRVKNVDLSGLVVKASRLQYVLVEYDVKGKPTVYVIDGATRSILVVDVAANKSYRVVLPNAVVGNKRDVLYAVLVQKGCGNNFIILTYLSSNKIFSIRTDYLRAGCVQGKIESVGVKDCKLVVLGTDGGSAVFFRPEGEQEVYRWDTNEPFALGKPVYVSPPCHLATHVVPDYLRRKMRVLQSNFPDYIQNTVGCGASQLVSLMVSELPK